MPQRSRTQLPSARLAACSTAPPQLLLIPFAFVCRCHQRRRRGPLQRRRPTHGPIPGPDCDGRPTPPPHIYTHTHTSLQGLKHWELSCSYSKVLQLLSVFHTGNPLFSTWLQRLWSSGLLHLQELFHHQLSRCCFCEAATFIKLNEMLVALMRHFCLVMLSLKCDDTAVQTEGKKNIILLIFRDN